MAEDDTEPFTEQAKWLIDRHLRRSEGLATRSAALLGFTGVTLALVLSGVNSTPVKPNAWVWASLTLTTGSLLATAFCCIRALSTTETAIPASTQIRGWWHDHAQDIRRGVIKPHITETFLNATNLDKDSPIDSAMKLADYRARWFQRATFTLMLALASLVTLVLQALTQTARN